MRVLHTLILAPLIFGGLTDASASECKHPDALGTSRVLEVDPHAFPMVGKVQYMETLRLKDREVVLTFDDGPVDEGTDLVLDVLARECAKATFFMIGLNAAESPELARRVYDEGHTVGFHTFSHPDVETITFDKAKADINKGIAAVREALGPTRNAAPFYRPPYLSMTKELERYLHSNGMMIWSIDADSDDWMPGTTDDELLKRTLDRLEEAGKGILLLHDIQPITTRVLPRLLVELKKRNFKLVHVVPTPDKKMKSVAAVMSTAIHDGWYGAFQQLLSIISSRASEAWVRLTKTVQIGQTPRA
jgi:peptidoglycan/xylan/chitin deacetylase (PgdA/CDA1 family)